MFFLYHIIYLCFLSLSERESENFRESDRNSKKIFRDHLKISNGFDVKLSGCNGIVSSFSIFCIISPSLGDDLLQNTMSKTSTTSRALVHNAHLSKPAIQLRHSYD